MFSELMTLRQHRTRRTMSIRDLAQAAQTGTQTIVKIERGEGARPSSFKKIAAALGVEPQEIREFMQMVMREDVGK